MSMEFFGKKLKITNGNSFAGFFNRYQMRKGEIYINRRRFKKKKKPQGARKDI